MTDEQWIEIPGWDKFQHYKDRNAPWIKLYKDLLHREEYLSLSGHLRGVLHGVWLAYASAPPHPLDTAPTPRPHLAGNTRSLSSHLRLRVTTQDLEALNQAGFITLVASNVLARRYQDASNMLALARAQPEGEGEREIPIPQDKPGAKPAQSANGPTNPRALGTNPRALGTNPRATQRTEGLRAWINRVKDEYTRPAILEELTKAYHLDPTTAATLLDQTLIQHPTAGHAGDADVPF